MSNVFELNCTTRDDQGKGANRRLRRLDNKVPVVLYGGDGESRPLSVSHDDIYHATENEAFFSNIITLNIDGRSEQAVIKALQRHPARPVILHADFLRVRADHAITVQVPIHFLNEDRCEGVRLEGGIVSKTLNEIEVTCLPGDLPEFIEVDLLELKIGDSIHLSEVTLPEKVSSVALSHGESGDLTVASVHARRVEIEEEPVEAEEEAAAEGEEGAKAEKAEEGDDSDKGDKGKDDKSGKGDKGDQGKDKKGS